jgi:hypothetical protein
MARRTARHQAAMSDLAVLCVDANLMQCMHVIFASGLHSSQTSCQRTGNWKLRHCTEISAAEACDVMMQQATGGSHGGSAGAHSR